MPFRAKQVIFYMTVISNLYTILGASHVWQDFISVAGVVSLCNV